jgi:hypothetical protein
LPVTYDYSRFIKIRAHDGVKWIAQGFLIKILTMKTARDYFLCYWQRIMKFHDNIANHKIKSGNFDIKITASFGVACLTAQTHQEKNIRFTINYQSGSAVV